ncbi:MAG: hypothetical protein HYX87_05435 [Chloroflexi bacterium]|nr:hypothetical protein [Chloroflexota bacterium]
MNNSARKELLDAVRSTDAMQHVLRDLEEEPFRLLCTIYAENAATQKPVPDHRLPLFSYFAEAALRSLVAAGFIKLAEESRYSLHEYEPTDKGKELAQRLTEEAACRPS